MSEPVRRARVMTVRGRVQGVGYRYFTVRAARRLGLGGKVRNLPDGSVEVAAVGEEEALASLRDELRRGPPAAHVTGLDERELLPVPDWQDFDVSYW
jgi:acylphosphatase